jgi:acetyl esterase/lipase
MKTLLLALALLVSVTPALTAAPEGKQQPKAPPSRIPEGVEVIHDVEIGAGGGRTLHAEIARPKNPPKTPMPAVLWIHGGGWRGGSHKGNRALPLAAQGYFTASIEYRLSGEATWPAQIEDCKLGVRWLRANAAKYHVNPDRIGCWGSSAGGHLAAFLGVSGDKTGFDGQGGHPGVSSRVQAVVDFCGPADMTEGSLGIQNATGERESPAVLGLAGAPFKEKPAVWKQLSPIIHVTPDDAPILIVHGDKDTTVPIVHSERFEAALKKAGVPVEFLRVKGGGHGMAAPKGEPPAEPDSNAINAAVLAFFDKHLKK